MEKVYPAFLEKGEGDDFGVWFPDLDGCTSAGDTAEHAFAMAHEALQGHIDVSLEYGDELPEPSSVEEAAERAQHEGGVIAVFLVPVRSPGLAKRINISLSGDVLDEVDAAAKARGMTRSGFLAEAARQFARTMRSLKEYGDHRGDLRETHEVIRTVEVWGADRAKYRIEITKVALGNSQVPYGFNAYRLEGDPAMWVDVEIAPALSASKDPNSCLAWALGEVAGFSARRAARDDI